MIARVDGLDLDPKTMRSIIDACQLRCGRTATADCVQTKASPIFELKKKYTSLDDHFHSTTTAKDITTTAYNSLQCSLVESGYADIKAEVCASYGCPVATAAVSASLNKSKSSSQFSFVAQRQNPRVDVELDHRCFKLTKKFEEDFKEYLTHNAFSCGVLTPDADAIYVREKFRGRYGHWVDLRAQLGGKLCFTRTVDAVKGENLKASEDGFESSVRTKFEILIAGGGSTSQEPDDIELRAIGGDHIKITPKNFGPWHESIAAIDTWKVIDVSRICNVLSLWDFMSDEYKTSIQSEYDALQRDIEAHWIETSAQQLAGSAVPSPETVEAPLPETVYALQGFRDFHDIGGYMHPEQHNKDKDWMLCCQKTDDESDSQFVFTAHNEKSRLYYIQSASDHADGYWLSHNAVGVSNAWSWNKGVGVSQKEKYRSIWKLIPSGEPMHFKMQCIHGAKPMGYLSVNQESQRNELVTELAEAYTYRLEIAGLYYDVLEAAKTMNQD